MILIAWGIVVLLGTSLGAPTTKTEVRYDGPDQIKVEHNSDDKIALPGIGSSPFAPNLFHNGANFFFNSHVILPGEKSPKIQKETFTAPLKDCDTAATLALEPITILETEPIAQTNYIQDIPEPSDEDKIEEKPIMQSIAFEDISKSPSNIDVDIEKKPDVESFIIEDGPKLPEFFEIPRLPVTVVVNDRSNSVICKDMEINEIIPGAPVFIEEPVQPLEPENNIKISDLPLPPELTPMVLSDIPRPIYPLTTVIDENIKINELLPFVPVIMKEPENHIKNSNIPPPPELPPIILPKLPTPVVLEEPKKVVLIPSAPHPTAFYPSSMILPHSKIPIPTDCAQNIVLERVLPYMASEYGRSLELISIPAAKRPPVVSSIIYP